MDPTEEDLQSPVFEAIWEVVKQWDIGRFGVYSTGTGTDVKEIMEAVRPFMNAALANLCCGVCGWPLAKLRCGVCGWPLASKEHPVRQHP